MSDELRMICTVDQLKDIRNKSFDCAARVAEELGSNAIALAIYKLKEGEVSVRHEFLVDLNIGGDNV